MTTNTRSSHFSKTIIATLTLLLLTGLSAAAGADFSSYSQPDPANYDLAVTSDGNAPSEASEAFSDDNSYQTIADAAAAADGTGSAESILVFANTSEKNLDQSNADTLDTASVDNNPAVVIDGDEVSEVASYYGPESTTINFEWDGSQQAMSMFHVNDGATLKGFNISAEWNDFGIVAGDNAVVKSNIIEGSEKTANLNGVNIKVASGESNVKIENNRVHLTSDLSTGVTSADYVAGIQNFGSSVEIIDNTVNQTGAYDGALANRGIELPGTDETVTGNKLISSQNNPAIHVFDGNEYREDILDNNDLDVAAKRTEGDVGVTSITNSINLAASYASSGETIDVSSGTFDESVTIDTSGLTIEGSGKSSTKITRTPSSPSGDATLDIQAPGITVSNLEVERVSNPDRTTEGGYSGHAQGVVVRDGTINNGIQISDVKVTGDMNGNNLERFDGIVVLDSQTRSADNVDISRTTVEGFYGGIVTSTFYSESGGVSDVTVTDSVLKNNRDGIVVKRHANPVTGITVENSELKNNDNHGLFIPADTIDYQGYTSQESADASEVTFKNNVITGNSVQNGNDSVLDATNNFWGDSSGPSSEGSGSGASVSTNLNYAPWYIDSELTDLSNETAESLSVTNQPIATQTAGEVIDDGDSGSPEVTILDYEGNQLTGTNVDVSVSLTGEGSLTEDSTTEVTGNGALTFDDLVTEKAETGQSLEFEVTESNNGYSPSVETSTFDVDPAAPEFVFSNVPSSVTAGNEFSFDVDVQDEFGNLIKDYGSADVTTTEGDDIDTTLSFTDGEASFSNSSLSTATDSQSITVSDGSDSFSSTTSEFSVDYTVSSGDSIQGAIDVAPEDQTITVDEGTYDQNVELSTPNVSLEASDSGEVTLRFNGSSSGATVDLVSNGTSIEGFEVIRGSDGLDWAQGIRVSANHTEIIENDVEVRDNGSEVVRPGIMVIDPSGASVENVSIEENTVNGSIDGVMITSFYGNGVSDVSVEGNTIEDNVRGLTLKNHDGNSAVSPEDVSVTNNVFEDNIEAIHLTGNENSIEGYPVRDFDPAQADIEGNTIRASNQYGVNNSASEAVDVTDNYWGAASGPEGSGADVTGAVDFEPWLLEADGTEHEETVSLTGGDWSLVSAPESVESSNVVVDNGSDFKHYVYDTEASQFVQPEGAIGSNPLSATFVYASDASGVGLNYSDSSSASKDVSKGWNVISSNQEIKLRDALSPVAGSLNSFFAPADYNDGKLGGLYSDLGDRSSEVVDASSLDYLQSEFGSSQKVSRYDGYWVKASGSSTLELSVPQPE